jgi:DNA-directed RNA polymerase subunit M/transcription elongation factor TFIIS
MNFANLRPVTLCNYNHLVPNIDAPDFLEKIGELRDSVYRRDNFPNDKEKKYLKFKNTEIFINQSKEFHCDKYGYEYTVYLNANTYVIIFCKKCGKYFYQTAKNHTQYGCFDCARIEQADRKKLKESEFVRRAKPLHRHCDYGGIKFIDGSHKVENILCTLCDKYFDSFAQAHINPNKPIGCPYCRRSKAEIIAENYLVDMGYKFDAQFSDPSLRLTNLLKIDFMIYVNGEMRAVELNGKQHYVQANRSKDMELNRRNFLLYQERDKIKVVWCAERGISLLVIPYWDFKRIPELIEEFIKE